LTSVTVTEVGGEMDGSLRKESFTKLEIANAVQIDVSEIKP
jgi:hypothetical protein